LTRLKSEIWILTFGELVEAPKRSTSVDFNGYNRDNFKKLKQKNANENCVFFVFQDFFVKIL
jgi:hypothetical protein